MTDVTQFDDTQQMPHRAPSGRWYGIFKGAALVSHAFQLVQVQDGDFAALAVNKLFFLEIG
ncbi:hypothetical protein SAMN04487941_0958 [Pontibacter akesuensis]|uniref:Uncharacterized protein n=1 Tax=Pontibacter akesuensis TaxID=388950 RepID=A0A1I7GEL7_9BACT|nr:hypothetical protein SAMN04487941_0958 [Pontibacter akesuensis]